MNRLQLLITRVLFTTLAFAPFAASAATEGAEGATSGLGALGPAIAISIAALGGALGQGRTASAALEGMARNPQAKLQTPMILGLALIESLVIFALLIAFVKY